MISLVWLLFFQEAGKEYYLPHGYTETDCYLLKAQYEVIPPDVWAKRGIDDVGPFLCISMGATKEEKLYQGLVEVLREVWEVQEARERISNSNAQ